MDITTLDSLKEWFAAYCATFYSDRTDEQRNILLKEEHTYNVCAVMTRIASEEGLHGEQLATAEAIALFHDVGRFEQYRRYGTFRDSDSINHAAFGAQLLSEKGLLAALPERERQIVEQSVRFHNVFDIPDNIVPDILPFLRLIRDADKVDIWRVFTGLFALPPQERASAASLGFPETGGYTRDLLESIYEEKMIALTRLNTLDDFKLLQLSWVFDMNCSATFRLLRERDGIGQLAATLPDDPAIRDVVKFLRGYIERRL